MQRPMEKVGFEDALKSVIGISLVTWEGSRYEGRRHSSRSDIMLDEPSDTCFCLRLSALFSYFEMAHLFTNSRNTNKIFSLDSFIFAH